MKDARGRAACGEENLFFTEECETRIACCEGTFTTQGCGHVVGGKRIPMFAVGRLQQKKFTVDGIAEGKALFFGKASDGVEEEFFAIVRVLQVPGFAAIGGFVDTGFFALADGYEI